MLLYEVCRHVMALIRMLGHGEISDKEGVSEAWWRSRTDDGWLGWWSLHLLLDNDLRHTPADTRVELNVSADAEHVVFRVRDHGKQIYSEDLQYLTQRFWRNGNSEGCGLGLAIVQAIVQRCSCSLTFDSQVDGLRVELGMPLRD